MPDRVRIDAAAALAPGDRKTYAVGEHQVAVFNVAGRLFAIDDRCPHAGGSLGDGAIEGDRVGCPLHGWRFDLASGRCEDRPGQRVRTFPVFAAGADLYVEFDDSSNESASDETVPDGIHRYLIRYGTLGWVGRFGATERIECASGDRVVVHTSRGIEVGRVLATPDEQVTVGRDASPAGELMRVLAESETPPNEPREIFEKARSSAAERSLSIEFVDCERLFDGETVILYYVGEELAGLEDLRSMLETHHAVPVRCEPLFDPPPTTGGGCGSGGCGGGGCSG